MKKYIKFIFIGALLVALLIFFKPKKIKAPSLSSTNGKTGKGLNSKLGGFIDGLNKPPPPPPTVYAYVSTEQMKVIKERRKKSGGYTPDFSYGDTGSNFVSQLGLKDVGNNHANYYGIFKGLDLKPTGANVWILKEHNIFASVKKNTGNKLIPHWSDKLAIGDYLSEA